MGHREKRFLELHVFFPQSCRYPQKRTRHTARVNMVRLCFQESKKDISTQICFYVALQHHR